MKMTRDEAKNYVKMQLPSYLSSKGINAGKPFKCLNPSHSDGHPSMSYDKKRNKCHCFSCGADYDIIDLIKNDYGLTDDKAAFDQAYSYYGVELENDYTGSSPKPQATPKQVAEPQPQAEDFTSYFLKAHENVSQTDYLKNRGLSDAIIDRFKLGYDTNFSRGTGGARWQAVIIPTTKYSFTARNTAAEVDKKDRIRKAGGSVLFNTRAFNSGKPVFIVEGEIDALSILEVGGEAAALGSTANYHKLAEYLKKRDIKTPLIILALDNDADGKATTENLIKELGGFDKCRVIPQYDIYGQYKDANEMLVNDREALTAAVTGAYAIMEQEKEQIKAEYSKNNAKSYAQNFLAEMRKPENTVFYPTGFSGLDELLDGGLYNGLYCVGAISSLGKTTFCLQIIDQIAQQGHDVLVFSLEMARYELMAKSISRLSYNISMELHGSSRCAKTTRGLMSGGRYEKYSIEEMRVIHAAIEKYEQYSEHIYIHEGMGNIGVKEVREIVEQHKTITGKAPIVLIDYLQILAPFSEGATDKQNTDKAVLELKRLSRDFAIPVIGISSFNRDNYTAPVNMASFKESGAVEYSSDVLLALQYEGMDWQDGEKEQERNKRVRELMNTNEAIGRAGKAQKIQVKVLKNRNGSKGCCLIDFIPMFNNFMDNTNAKAMGDGFVQLEMPSPFDEERKVDYGKKR